MLHIKLIDHVGAFAENKDIAKELRVNQIIPELDSGGEVVLDFEKIDSAAQSFVHALISDLLRKRSSDVLDKISFKSCNETIQKIISIVIEYMQESE